MKSLFKIINHSKGSICFEELKVNLQLSLKCGGMSLLKNKIDVLKNGINENLYFYPVR